MGEFVKYYLDFIPLDVFGIYIRDSKGLIDIPNPKSNEGHNWHEYSGKEYHYDIATFEERKIELDCFIIADDWSDIVAAYHKFLDWFYDKIGTKRLVVKPFGYNALVFDIILEKEIKIKKRFSKGQMVGTFTLNLKEPDPIKMVFESQSEEVVFSLQGAGNYTLINGVSYLSELGETINVQPPPQILGMAENGLHYTYKPNYFSGAGTTVLDGYDSETGSPIWKWSTPSEFGGHLRTDGNYISKLNVKAGETYYLVFEAISSAGMILNEVKLQHLGSSPTSTIGSPMQVELSSSWETYVIPITPTVDTQVNTLFITVENPIEGINSKFKIKNLRVIKNKSTKWQKSIYDSRFIVVAGNIRDIGFSITDSERIL